ncbi:Wzz/FepE/Etk N-terminal domain-containing protein [Pseudohaliea rubra]|uniref:Regulator of length of O-antigen component of lipopolysaccharide chain n=1 Tax=Pseudohaliea rubra DSM 19751 TaxID=1265313 RepID=A0A095VQU8_9GAMM|nr:Wzz/FepE/Etk N-terminal domain-containing protein [Pseudohaliea rubra]KGE03837.1 regulator of length of O-antigen component of lipopolysaccharide chain [Pseudohaliea rubra DSM 19751]
MNEPKVPQPTAAPPGYYPVTFAEDEIDLFELALTLWRQRLLVLAITLAAPLLAAGYLLLIAEPVYESEARLLPPAAGSLEKIVIPRDSLNSSPAGETRLTVTAEEPDDGLTIDYLSAPPIDDIFQRVAEQLFAQETRRAALLAISPPEGTGPGQHAAGSFTVAMEKPDRGSELGESLSVRFRAPDPQLAAAAVAALVAEAQTRATQELLAGRSAVLERRIEMLQGMLAASVETARLAASHRATRLRAAIETASSLGLEDPAPLASLSLQPGTDDALYLRGARLLRAELNALEARSGDSKGDAFLPFAPDAATLEAQIAHLQTIVTQPVDGIEVARLDQPATVPAAAASPRPRMVLALAAVLGLFAGIGTALVRSAIGKRLEQERQG